MTSETTRTAFPTSKSAACGRWNAASGSPARSLYASADGESYTSLGAVYMPASPQDPAKFTYAFRLDETLKARYIRLAFSKQEAGWFFIDEISAYAYSADNAPEQGTVAQYYGDPTVPASEPSYWPETDADYDETLNLALGAEHIYVQHFSELEPRTPFPRSTPRPLHPDGRHAPALRRQPTPSV
ncbi:MAG: hypothetical protein ACLUFV_13470 [Acutalibacteraceae bacterium]